MLLLLDFSDSIVSKRKQGYGSDLYEFDSNETPLEKLNRIQRELSELKADLSNSEVNITLPFDEITPQKYIN